MFKVSKGMPPVIFTLAQLARDDTTKASEDRERLRRQRLPHAGCRPHRRHGRVGAAGHPAHVRSAAPRFEGAIARAEAYGVTVKMVTGDDVAIGKTIAEELGLGSNIVAASGHLYR